MSSFFSVIIDGVDRQSPSDATVSIGRSKNNTIMLSDSKASRNHAVIRMFGDGHYYIMDLGSSNGTFLNGRQIVMPSLLKDGDSIRIGIHTLVFACKHHGLRLDEEYDDQTCATMITANASVQEITTLVSDIRNYTSMSEKVPVGEMGRLLSKWFRKAGDIVESNGGVVDKFIGDAIMVRWLNSGTGAGASLVSALKTAVEFGKAARQLNNDNPDLPHGFRVGVGINTGQALLGNVGADMRRDYTALGDAVNLAFRFESVSKTCNADVVVGYDTCRHLGLMKLDEYVREAEIKGRNSPVKVCVFTFDQIPVLLSGS